MAGYDPQARRARPSVTDDSPVDDLLGQVPVEPVEPVTVDGGSAGGESPSGAEARPPFDTPQVEMTDENADRLQRLAVLGAVIAFVLLLLARRRRTRR